MSHLVHNENINLIFCVACSNEQVTLQNRFILARTLRTQPITQLSSHPRGSALSLFHFAESQANVHCEWARYHNPYHLKRADK